MNSNIAGKATLQRIPNLFCMSSSIFRNLSSFPASKEPGAHECAPGENLGKNLTMLRKTVIVFGFIVAAAPAAKAHDEQALANAPAGDPYVKVSDVLPLPEFIPGLGTLFVDPATLPAGPFLAYDRDGRLSATVYMTPLDDLQNGTSFDGLNIGSHTVSSTDIYYNAGHPGVDKPHAHIVLFHDENAKDRLAE